MAKAHFWPLLPPITDEQAMWRLQMHDDTQAFAQLVTRWEKPIFALCARMVGDAHRGEDLKQEAFSRVFARRKEYRPDAKFSTWLWRIALNLCYDELRRRQRRGECALEITDDGQAADEHTADDLGPDERLVAKEESEL